MSNVEHELPSRYSLNSAFLEHRDEVVKHHRDGIVAGTLGDKLAKPAIEIKMEPRVIDQDLEINHLDSLWGSTDALLSIMGYHAEDYDAKAAVHRGLSFGLQAAEAIKQVNVNGLATEYLSDIAKYEGSLLLLKGDVLDYLEASPDLSEYIAMHASDINHMKHEVPGGAGEVEWIYTDCVELSAGLVFMLTERELARIYSERHTTN